MSQIILDDQLFGLEVLVPIARWITVQRLRDLRPGEVIKDDRVPVLLRQLRQPSFVTIDMGFWDRGLRDARYCVLCQSCSVACCGYPSSAPIQLVWAK